MLNQTEPWTNTFGKKPSQINLEKILIELNDSSVTRLVCQLYDEAKQDLSRIRKYIQPYDARFFRRCWVMFYRLHKQNVNAQRGKMPDSVRTHLLCSLSSEFRNAYESNNLSSKK